MGPVRVNYKESEALGRVWLSQEPRLGKRITSQRGCFHLCMSHVLSPVGKLELRVVKRGGQMSVFSSCSTRGPISILLVELRRAADQTEVTVGRQALIFIQLSCKLSQQGKDAVA